MTVQTSLAEERIDFSPPADRISEDRWGPIRALIALLGRRPTFVAALAAALLVADADILLQHAHPSYGVSGMLDEPAHMATAFLFLMALRRWPPLPFVLGCLLASILIDADHIPIVLNYQPLIAATHRPYTHSLTTPAIVLAPALMVRGRWRLAAFGAVAGLLFHFARDLATDYVPLFWPITRQEERIPYNLYAGLLIVLTLLALLHSMRTWRSNRSTGRDPLRLEPAMEP